MRKEKIVFWIRWIVSIVSLSVSAGPLSGLRSAERRYGKLERRIRYDWAERKEWLKRIDLGRLGIGYINRDLYPSLSFIITELELLGLIDEVLVFKGCYSPRPVRGTSYPSHHAYGLACDFIPKLSRGYSDEFIRVWEKWGWCHGRRFRDKDEMHFSRGWECG